MPAPPRVILALIVTVGFVALGSCADLR